MSPEILIAVALTALFVLLAVALILYRRSLERQRRRRWRYTEQK